MRKWQKLQIEELVKTISEAHEEIGQNLADNRFTEAMDILVACQEVAIDMGTVIEKAEAARESKIAKEAEAEFVTVTYLKEYCELVYHLYEALSANTGQVQWQVPWNKYEEMLKTWEQIKISVQKDIKIQKEIVFLPYKASMWDSLESVWKVAVKDPNCDVYVIPIPYYDRNADRSLREIHYEGEQYPDYVRVTKYEEYDFGLHRPDTIYIHNPYDDCNSVTSVHPFFFASNLKKFTDELIYIPYFVLKEIEPDNQEQIDTMKHFCFLPGVIHADKVILQSEAMRQIYIKEYQKEALERGLKGKHVDKKALEEKFLGSGSPKFDRLVKTKREELEIPKEWLQIIQKPDGTWKKIMFYNTSVVAFLEHRENMLDKIRDTFTLFQENKEEIALLWRPHPLMEATIASRCPQLLAEYQEIVNQYKTENWGIYDDSADLDRAVILCDAYYGDASSVVQLCQRVGKPVLVQDVGIRAVME